MECVAFSINLFLVAVGSHCETDVDAISFPVEVVEQNNDDDVEFKGTVYTDTSCDKKLRLSRSHNISLLLLTCFGIMG